ncbi:MAG: phosphate acetyltransferase [Candidatus Marinimicrobia bacterium]|jgi:phosphate acetyltransferase|nr:phosphate acetyltransferase [Candidatus Neomarinimicrobiota bacterium]MBT3632153.1 phosphate acetyltransferase [Candidatus Neomarinimicrobiota bacterium]MBT3824283.1 phosphate acetyltransferase [Candidatus Neomarinimicrobiota bacterium]MBT4129104.1 phosphate acetyltransferase [Candidatus Neomarinimicrobiota bacterium]MBT4295657.1 phosphate acetyltransferase [Candidatus Neomarinimicrobiota bacterium]
MNIVDRFITKAQDNPARIVYPEASDPRILEAVVQVQKRGIAQPVLVGNPDQVKALATELGLALTGIEIIDSKSDSRLDTYSQAYAKKRDLREAIAKKLVRKPLSFGGMMVSQGEADGMVAGVATATSIVIQTATLTVGFQESLSTPSSFFIMIIPEFQGEQDKIFLFADSAVNIQPNAQQLAEIAIASGTNAKALLGINPKIAFLSFSTKGSAGHEDADKVIEALSIAGKINPEFDMDGELQLDAAIVPSVAAKKVKESTVAGQANVLVFPDLDAGNIGYKLVQYMANAKAIGPILQGFAKPVNDMSRGASVDDLIAVSAITSVQAKG